MRILANSLPIDDLLTSSAIDTMAFGLSRYHLIKDLAVKGPDQIACFLQRIEQIYNRPERIKLSLISVLYEGATNSEHPEMFPLFDFIGIHTSTCEAYGVMFSTYLHDLDREAIIQDNLGEKDAVAIQIGRLLVDSLFMPTQVNNGRPPFPDHRPLFVFPRSRSTLNGTQTSSTDRYMAQLGFNVSNYSTRDTPVLRFFHHEDEVQPFDCGSIDPAIIAVGQVCVEMAEELSPVSRNCLQPFDRSGLSDDVKSLQTKIAQRWYKQHKNYLEHGGLGMQVSPAELTKKH